MFKYFKFTTITSALFIAPPLLYIFANFYWWLFDGNKLNGDKMYGAFVGIVFGLIICGGVYLAEDAYYQKEADK